MEYSYINTHIPYHHTHLVIKRKSVCMCVRVCERERERELCAIHLAIMYYKLMEYYIHSLTHIITHTHIHTRTYIKRETLEGEREKERESS